MSYLKKLLRPVFVAIAAPGISMPHGDYETELMVAGVKPAITINPECVTPEMKEAVGKGQITLIADHQLTKIHRIYCHKNEINTAKQAAKILDRAFNYKETPSAAEENLLNNFFNSSTEFGPPSRSFSNWRESPQPLSLALLYGQTTSEIDSMLNGKLLALPPVIHVPGLKTENPLETARAEGKISAVDFEEKVLMQVFAQANHVEEGKELNARCYLNKHEYPALPEIEATRRIGKLLGYTDNDVSWFIGEKYKNPILREFMHQTAPLRRWARKELMLMDANP